VPKPTLLRERAENTQVMLAVIVPLLFGAVAGALLAALGCRLRRSG
jgi:hypothetical protein